MKYLTQKVALFASAVGMSVLAVAPALADNHTSESMNEDSSAQMMEQESQSDMGNSVVTVAANSQGFNTLVQAVEAAGLKDTLASGGPYTVFAPTDEAFAELPDGALEYLLQPENQELLKQVLTYHVVPSEVTSSEISTGTVDTLGGGVAVLVNSAGVIVNNASVINADIQADNGVIHAINRVLMPSDLREQLVSQLQSQ
ncbi:MAG: fasciclin domain-containing protein [Cyanophyceae cyanobacterium]